MRLVRILLLAGVLLLTGLAGCVTEQEVVVQTWGPPVEGGDYKPNVSPTIATLPHTTVSSGSEPSIHVSHDGTRIYIGDTSGVKVSADNGTTWSQVRDNDVITLDGYSVAEDDEGRIYYATTAGAYINVLRSDDKGNTIAWTSYAAEAGGVSDRPWLAARGDGEVVLMHYDYGRTFSESCARSTDAGMTWLDRGVLKANAHTGGPKFDADGGMYLVSTDGTLTYYPNGCAGTAQRMAMFDQVGRQSMPMVAVDETGIYSTMPSSGNGAIVLAGIKQFGDTPKRITISPPEIQSNTYATIAVHDGKIGVAWYGSETPGNPSDASFSGSWNVYAAEVEDFWQNEGPRRVGWARVTPSANHAGDICMDGISCGGSSDRDLLDYFMMDYDKWGGIHIAYVHDGATANAETRYAHLLPGQLIEGVEFIVGAEEAIGSLPIINATLSQDGLVIKGDASNSYDPDGGPVESTWKFGDGIQSLGDKVEHTYAEPGTYGVDLYVRDEDQQVVVQNFVVTVSPEVSNESPVAIIEGPATAEIGDEIEFHDKSTDDGEIVARVWALGDGSDHQDGQIVTHSYSEPGTYWVQLLVADDWDARSETVHEIKIIDPDAVVEPEPIGEEISVDNVNQEAPLPLLALVTGLLVATLWRRR